MAVANKTIIVLIVSLALFMDSLDATIINTAIPSMARSLQVNAVDLKIALISYLLVLAIFIPISGWIADKYGIKRVFITAMCIFTVGSWWCGYSHNLMELVVARCLQGLGGALMLPLGRLIMLHSFPRHELVNAMNHVVMIISLGLMLGPVAGGFITDHFSWPWIFWVNIPVGFFAILMATIFFKDTLPRRVRPFDSLGFILFGGGLAALTFSLSDLSESSATTDQALFIMGISILMLFGYFLHARKQKHPIVNMDLFGFRTFRVSVLGNLLGRLSFGGVPFLMPLLLQIPLHYSAQLSGILMVPIAFGVVLVKATFLRLLHIMGFKKLLFINTFFVSLSLILFLLIGPSTPIVMIGVLTFIFGVMVSIQYSGLNSLAYSDISTEHMSSATSIISTVQQISQSMGVAISAIFLRLYSIGSDQTFSLTPRVFHLTFITMSLFTLSSLFFVIRLKPQDGHQMIKAPTQDNLVAD